MKNVLLVQVWLVMTAALGLLLLVVAGSQAAVRGARQRLEPPPAPRQQPARVPVSAG